MWSSDYICIALYIHKVAVYNIIRHQVLLYMSIGMIGSGIAIWGESFLFQKSNMGLSVAHLNYGIRRNVAELGLRSLTQYLFLILRDDRLFSVAWQAYIMQLFTIIEKSSSIHFHVIIRIVYQLTSICS